MAAGLRAPSLPHAYSSEISHLLAEDGVEAERCVVASARAELYEQVPFLAVQGSCASTKRDIIRSVSKANLGTLQRLSQLNLQALAAAGRERAELNVDHAAELEKMVRKRERVTGSLAMAAAIPLVMQFLAGYNTAVLNAPADVVFPGHSTTAWALAVGAFAVGGPGGALSAGTLADRIGRKPALVMCTWIFFWGGLMLALAPNMAVLVVARLVTGFASGFASVLVPIFMGELAPPALRGLFGTCTQFAMVIGILVATVLGFPLATADGWRWMFALTSFTCVALLLAMPLSCESPRWLLSKDPQSSQAMVVLRSLFELHDNDALAVEVAHILNACAVQDSNPDTADTPNPIAPKDHAQPQADSHAKPGSEGGDKSPWRTLWGDRDLRQLMTFTLVLHVSQQFCGINAVFYYSRSFFDGVIDDPLLGATLVAGINVLATLLATVLMDVTGRRMLTLTSLSGMVFSTVFVIAALLGLVPKVLAVASVMAFVGFFEIGLGPIPWLIVAEVFEPRFVATAQSVACQVNWFSNFVVGTAFPFLAQALRPCSFVPFGLVLVVCWVYVAARMPETLNRSPQEVLDEVKGCQDSSGLGLVEEEQYAEALKQYRARLSLARRSVSHFELQQLQVPRSARSDSGPIEF